MTFTFHTTHNDEDAEWEVEYLYHHGLRSPRDEVGRPVSPDDVPEIEILTVTDKAGNEVTPTKEQAKLIDEAAWKDLEQQANDDQNHRYPPLMPQDLPPEF